MISVSDGDTLVASYMYDARNHRIKKTVGNETRLYYFNQQWQCVEERVGTTVDATWIYGLRYIDDVVCSVKNTEVLYALQDPNWNVVALVNTSGTVQERMTYDSFGRITFRDASFVANASKTTSSYNWTKTFTGQVYDVETGLMLYRNRYYHPTLGRFITRDPIGYRGEDSNLYRYVYNFPCTATDIWGLKKKCQLPPQTNGCGGAGLNGYLVPDSYFVFDFEAACNEHDACYATGGKSQEFCDYQFRDRMEQMCAPYKDYRWNPFALVLFASCMSTAASYFGFVRTQGKPFFEDAKKEYCREIEDDECCGEYILKELSKR